MTDWDKEDGSGNSLEKKARSSEQLDYSMSSTALDIIEKLSKIKTDDKKKRYLESELKDGDLSEKTRAMVYERLGAIVGTMYRRAKNDTAVNEERRIALLKQAQIYDKAANEFIGTSYERDFSRRADLSRKLARNENANRQSALHHAGSLILGMAGITMGAAFLRGNFTGFAVLGTAAGGINLFGSVLFLAGVAGMYVFAMRMRRERVY